SFRGEADEGGREPGIYNPRPVVMGSGFAFASLRRPGMTTHMIRTLETLDPKRRGEGAIECAAPPCINFTGIRCHAPATPRYLRRRQSRSAFAAPMALRRDVSRAHAALNRKVPPGSSPMRRSARVSRSRQ